MTYTKFFFADKNDINHILKCFDDEIDVTYTKAIFSPELEILTADRLSKIDNDIGTASAKQYATLKNYVILPKEILPTYTQIAQRKGPPFFLLDGTTNLDSLCLKLGGIYDDINLISSYLYLPLTHSAIAVNNFKVFLKIVKKYCKIVDGDLVAPGAFVKLESGFKLVLGVGEYALDIKKGRL